MSGPQALHNALLRPPIIQILRAAGYHSAPPSVIDTLADLTIRYLLLLGSSAAEHAANSHPEDPVPTLADMHLALLDVGALRPQMKDFEEDWAGEEDMRGLDAFMSWFTGPVNREIRRIAGYIPSEGDVIDADSLEKEDYLTSLKKKHSKTGEEFRYAGTVLGRDAEEHPIVIEGGAATSIGEWALQVKTREPYADSLSSAISSVPSSLSEDELAGELEAALAADVDEAPGAAGSSAAPGQEQSATPSAAKAGDESSGDESEESEHDGDGEADGDDDDMDEEELERRREIQEQREFINELEGLIAQETAKYEMQTNKILKQKIGKRVQQLKQDLALKKASIGGTEPDGAT